MRQLIAAAIAAVSADTEPRPRACLSMSGRDWLNIIGHAAVVDGSGVHRPLFQWDLSHSLLQNESRGYAIALESSLGLHHCCAICPDRRSEESIRLSLSSIRTSITTENHIPERMNHCEIAVLAPVMNEVQFLFASERCKPQAPTRAYSAPLNRGDSREAKNRRVCRH